MQSRGRLVARHAATDEAAALRDAQAACEMRIETVEAEMSEIDRLLAAMTDD